LRILSFILPYLRIGLHNYLGYSCNLPGSDGATFRGITKRRQLNSNRLATTTATTTVAEAGEEAFDAVSATDAR